MNAITMMAIKALEEVLIFLLGNKEFAGFLEKKGVTADEIELLKAFLGKISG